MGFIFSLSFKFPLKQFQDELSDASLLTLDSIFLEEVLYQSADSRKGHLILKEELLNLSPATFEHSLTIRKYVLSFYFKMKSFHSSSFLNYPPHQYSLPHNWSFMQEQGWTIKCYRL